MSECTKHFKGKCLVKFCFSYVSLMCACKRKQCTSYCWSEWKYLKTDLGKQNSSVTILFPVTEILLKFPFKIRQYFPNCLLHGVVLGDANKWSRKKDILTKKVRKKAAYCKLYLKIHLEQLRDIRWSQIIWAQNIFHSSLQSISLGKVRSKALHSAKIQFPRAGVIHVSLIQTMNVYWHVIRSCMLAL